VRHNFRQPQRVIAPIGSRVAKETRPAFNTREPLSRPRKAVYMGKNVELAMRNRPEHPWQRCCIAVSFKDNIRTGI
jgi:hypothetical protein